MYLAFFGLKEKPFNATPNPRFLFLTEGHREALAQMMYGVQESKGFIVLTGEVGTGKTTLLQTLLQRLDSSTAVAFIFNSTLPFDGLLEYMLEDLGVTKVGETRAQRLFALNNFLIERRRAGQQAVVIIDEAQNLDAATLEQIRLLSNFETPTDKLLQILLVGQPELRQKLDLPGLRQLKQRIGLRCVITPLTPQEVGEYIRTRLRIAGARDLRLYTDAAVSRIAEYSRGIPRIINMLCDHCLLIAFADQTRKIERDVVEQAIQYLDAEQSSSSGTRREPRAGARRWLLGALGVAIIGTGMALTLHPSGRGGLWNAWLHVWPTLLDAMRSALGIVTP